MDKKSLKKLALLGVTSGLVLSAQTQVSAEIVNQTNAGTFLAAGCGSGACTGNKSPGPQVSKRSTQNRAYTAQADDESVDGVTGATGTTGAAMTSSKLAWNDSGCNSPRSPMYSNSNYGSSSCSATPRYTSGSCAASSQMNQANQSYSNHNGPAYTSNGCGAPQGRSASSQNQRQYTADTGGCGSSSMPRSYSQGGQQSYNGNQQANQNPQRETPWSTSSESTQYGNSGSSQQYSPNNNNARSSRSNQRSYTADVSSEEVSNQANSDRSMTESALFSQLSDAAKAQYRTLDDEGKAYALNAASSSNMTNKDQAVQAAVARMNAQKRSGATMPATPSGARPTNSQIPMGDTSANMNQAKPSNW